MSNIRINIKPFQYLTEVSSQANFIPPRPPPAFELIRYYEQLNGNLEPLKDEHQNNLVFDTDYLYGLNLNGILHPLCDADGIRVVRRRSDRQTIPISPEIAQRFGFNQPPWNRRNNSQASSSPSN